MSTLNHAGAGQNSTDRQAAAQQAAERERVAEAALARRRWTAVGVALTTMTFVVGASTWLVLGTQWLGLAVGACVAAIALAAYYTVAGRTVGMNNDVRERVLERHYIGVAWYTSMLRTSREPGGYDRGLRRELTRLAAARLAERHGVNLYRDPGTAAALLGTDVWPLVDPALLTGERAGTGIGTGTGAAVGARAADPPMRAVAELIERLERL
ncbi:hypothetical protein GCM10009839_82190 [Catenulispora yoronensis]|uniref:Uncharacterized protein n=1 Tax=Catenulispora yoronensis TaxID=450799 RepID=A0ABN2VCP8_9ACTN